MKSWYETRLSQNEEDSVAHDLDNRLHLAHLCVIDSQLTDKSLLLLLAYRFVSFAALYPPKRLDAERDRHANRLDLTKFSEFRLH